MRDAPPELFKRSPRSLRPALFIAIDQHHGIHRTRGGARDTVDPQPWFLEKPIEHAPRKGAVRAATLQREIDQNGLTARVRRRIGRSGFHHTLVDCCGC